MNITDNDNNYLQSEDALYHYSSRRKALEGILSPYINKQELFFGNFSRTNDPFEFDSKWPIAQINRFEKDNLSNGIPRLFHNTILLDQLFNQKVSFISFSMNTYNRNFEFQDYGYNKPRMWAQYGDNHQGMCFVFSKSEINNFINGRNWYNKIKSNPVDYNIIEKDFSVVFEELNSIEDNAKLESKFSSLVERYTKHFFFQKHKDYEHESEYRIVRIDEKNQDGINLVGTLKAIILGHRFNMIYYPVLHHIVSIFRSLDLELPIYRYKWDISKGKLEFIPPEELDITSKMCKTEDK